MHDVVKIIHVIILFHIILLQLVTTYMKQILNQLTSIIPRNGDKQVTKVLWMNLDIFGGKILLTWIEVSQCLY